MLLMEASLQYEKQTGVVEANRFGKSISLEEIDQVRKSGVPENTKKKY